MALLSSFLFLVRPTPPQTQKKPESYTLHIRSNQINTILFSFLISITPQLGSHIPRIPRRWGMQRRRQLRRTAITDA